jgi:hypothetical protein
MTTKQKCKKGKKERIDNGRKRAQYEIKYRKAKAALNRCDSNLTQKDVLGVHN